MSNKDLVRDAGVTKLCVDANGDDENDDSNNDDSMWTKVGKPKNGKK